MRALSDLTVSPRDALRIFRSCFCIVQGVENGNRKLKGRCGISPPWACPSPRTLASEHLLGSSVHRAVVLTTILGSAAGFSQWGQVCVVTAAGNCLFKVLVVALLTCGRLHNARSTPKDLTRSISAIFYSNTITLPTYTSSKDCAGALAADKGIEGTQKCRTKE